ncbi:helix-turn-helix domain-containing protein [Blautia sp. HCP28S3_G10]|uniref:helix-turn-helix domain-containing protein n=1 Tax=Blautia sp. HCP28S3_G10 TaxID=3438908 RepID=UPI003F8905D5
MGTRIKNLRLENNMTLEELGNKVGVGKSTVRKWENGMIANMRRDKIAKLADALNVSPAYLMGWNESSAPAATIELYNVHCETKNEADLVLSYRKLNEHNQRKVLTYSQNLLSTQQMEEDVLAAHARTDVKQTSEGVQHDLDIMNDDSEWE